MSHTPGPWKSLFLSDGTYDIDGPNNELVCQIPVVGCSPREEESIANARLIAAAPKLLEACKAALCEVDSTKVFLLLEQAIAEAEGSK